MYSIPVVVTHLKPDQVVPFEGLNSREKAAYDGCCPPPGNTRTYLFTLYALDTVLTFATPPTKKQLMTAMSGDILGTKTMTGVFGR